MKAKTLLILFIFLSINVFGQSNLFTEVSTQEMKMDVNNHGQTEGNLTVANETIANGTISNHIADETITTSGNFKVEDGSVATMRAGYLICLKPGFLAEAGSEFDAKLGDGDFVNNKTVQNDKNPSSLKLNAMDIKAYPNPLSESTTFEFELLEEGNVVLEIFDISGKSVAVVIEKTKMEKGKHNLEFKAQSLMKGVYICKLSTNAEIATYKLIIE